MVDHNPKPNPHGSVPPITPDLVLCVPNLKALVLATVEAIEAGADREAAAHMLAMDLFSIFTSRLHRASIETITIPARFQTGGSN